MIYIKKEKLEEIIKHQNEIIEDLQQRIDKAERYTEKEIYYCLASGDNINIYLEKLLEILKGEDE